MRKLSEKAEMYEEAYQNYRNQCEGIAYMNPSTSWGKGGIEKRYKIAFFTALDLAFRKAQEQDSLKIDETSLQYRDMKIEYDHMVAMVEELRKKTSLQEAEINNLRACIKCKKMPEGYDVND